MRQDGFYWAKLIGDDEWLIVRYFSSGDYFGLGGLDRAFEYYEFSIIEDATLIHD